MTTLIPFLPAPDAPFQFQPTLDGNLYTAIVTWNLWGQRWYVNLYDRSNNLVFCLPLISSQATAQLASLAWDASGVVTAAAAEMLQYPIGSIAHFTISSAAPGSFNGAYPCAIINSLEFTYAASTDPGPMTAPGAFSVDVSMTAGYFVSTMVYRAATGNIEISP